MPRATFTGQTGDGLIIASGFTIDSSGNFGASPGEGILTVNTNAGNTAYDMELSYDVTDLDLSLGDRFAFNLSGDLDDRIPPATLSFDIELTSGLVTDTAGVTLSADGAYEILFSSFTGIDFSDIDGIKLLSEDGVLSPDFGINAVKVVPEPTTALLLAAGLSGLAAMGRRRSLH